jgi:soluble lytic murein transglycosylase-like protein
VGLAVRRFLSAQRVWRGAGAGALLVILLSSAASADVIEILGDGSTTTFAGPVISTADGLHPIGAVARARTSVAPPRSLSNRMTFAAGQYAISDCLIEAVAWQESQFNQQARSAKGAIGVMQLMPETARELGVDAETPAGNIDGGAAYLSKLLRLYDGDLILALSAYNAGPAAVTRYRGEPPFAETRGFVDGVLGRLTMMTEDLKPVLEPVP